jgi:DNA-binding response OmpR family regulator
MRVLIAEDEAISRRLLQVRLTKLGHEVVVTCDGDEAWAALEAPGAPSLAVIDWMMPGMNGPDVCRRVRARADEPYVYVILLTAKSRPEDEAEAREAGADDFLEKPFDAADLERRLTEGQRIVDAIAGGGERPIPARPARASAG